MRPVVHPLGIGPDGPQMFVVEDRHDAIVLLEGVGDFFEKASPWMQHLPFAIRRITPVFADADHAVNRYAITADGHSLFDRVENRHAILLCHRPSQVPVGKLIDVHRRQRQIGSGTAVLFPTFKDFPNEHIGMQAVFVGSDHGGD